MEGRDNRLIEHNISEVIRQLRQDINQIGYIQDRLVPTFAERAVELGSEEAPVGRTGRLANSLVAEGDKKEMRVRPTVAHAVHVISGTRPSPGRYVWQLGKRVLTGRHPGTPANPFMYRALNRLLDESVRILNRLVQL